MNISAITVIYFHAGVPYKWNTYTNDASGIKLARKKFREYVKSEFRYPDEFTNAEITKMIDRGSGSSGSGDDSIEVLVTD
jgi:hypothetical protein